MKAARSDANQAAIFSKLRDAGAVVFDTHRVGGGFPDCAALYNGRVHLLEIKVPGGRLTKAERVFHSLWGDSENVHVVFDDEQALEVVGALAKSE